MIGYKIAINNHRRVLVTLEVPANAITNINRKSVVEGGSDTATYVSNIVKVLKIQDCEDSSKEYLSAVSGFFSIKVNYRVGETIAEGFRSYGISFFISKKVARSYGLSKVENGIFQRWYPNGQTEIIINFTDGKFDGLYEVWFSNGKKAVEENYEYGVLEGSFRRWHTNGNKSIEGSYNCGFLQGPYTMWYRNGFKCLESYFADGIPEGTRESWDTNGKSIIKKEYSQGKEKTSNSLTQFLLF